MGVLAEPHLSSLSLMRQKWNVHMLKPLNLQLNSRHLQAGIKMAAWWWQIDRLWLLKGQRNMEREIANITEIKCYFVLCFWNRMNIVLKQFDCNSRSFFFLSVFADVLWICFFPHLLLCKILELTKSVVPEKQGIQLKLLPAAATVYPGFFLPYDATYSRL